MFKRIVYEDWTAIVPIVSFLLTAGVFAFTTVRAVMIPKKRRDHLASLPLLDRRPTDHRPS